MDVIGEMKKRQCDPGPVHSPHDECPCDMVAPCSCDVDNAAIAEIERLRKIETALTEIMTAHGPGTLASDELFKMAVDALNSK